MGQITIAMLTHNALEYTRACVESIELHTTVPHTLFILDNGSTDETPTWLAAQTAPHVHVLLGQTNVGVPRGRNLLLSRILPAPVDVLSGFCFWVRGQCAQSVGFFDENLGTFWHEDDDYCIRARLLGYEVFMLPKARLVHYGHKSGAADEGIPRGGSPENQQYLVNKWRMLGAVDDYGHIRSRALGARGLAL